MFQGGRYRATGRIVSQAILDRSLHANGEMSVWATLREPPTTNCTCDDHTFVAFTLRPCGRRGPDDRTTGVFAAPSRAAGFWFGRPLHMEYQSGAYGGPAMVAAPRLRRAGPRRVRQSGFHSTRRARVPMEHARPLARLTDGPGRS